MCLLRKVQILDCQVLACLGPTALRTFDPHQPPPPFRYGGLVFVHTSVCHEERASVGWVRQDATSKQITCFIENWVGRKFQNRTPELRSSWPAGEKEAEKWISPHRETGGQNGRKMGKIARKSLKNGIRGPFLPFCGHFSAHFPGEAISNFSAIFARFRAEGLKPICSRSTAPENRNLSEHAF